MKKFLIPLAILAGLGFMVLVVVLIAAGSYNGLVGKSQGVDKQWAQVQNVYQRRNDLIPNLVATVSGAANFEKTTLTAIVEARASVGKVTLNANTAPTDAAQLAAFEKAQGQLSTALSRLLVVSEQYPDLKATAGFRDLQAELEGTENRIAVARNKYIQAVQQFNITVRSFPSNLTAMMFGYKPKPNFTVEDEAAIAKPPVVDFGAPKPAASN